MTAFVNALIKINQELQIDFSFIDKIMTNMVGIKKDRLLEALKVVEIDDANDNLNSLFI